MAKALNFGKIYDIEPTYIHSHFHNFDTAVKTIWDNLSLEAILDELKAKVVEEINNQLEYFKMLENALIKELNKTSKTQIKSREDYIERYQSLTKLFGDRSSAVGKVAILKGKLDTRKLNEFVKKIVDNQTALLATEEDKFKTTEKTKSGRSRAKKEWKAKNKALIKKITKAIKLEFKKREKEYLQAAGIPIKIKTTGSSDTFEIDTGPLLESINDVFQYMGSVLSMTTEKGDKNVILSSAQKFFRIFEQIEKQTGEPFLEKGQKIEDYIGNTEKFLAKLEEADPVSLIRALTITKHFDFYDEAIENFQVPSILGQIFEAAFRDSIKSVLDKKGFMDLDEPVADLFLEKEDIRGGFKTGMLYDKTSTIDVEVNKIVHNGLEVFFGNSLKLKEGEARVALENTPIDQFMKILSVNAPKEFNQIQYLRKNILALQAYALSEKRNPQTKNYEEININSQQIITQFETNFNSFEKDIIFLSVIVRFLIGMLQKTSEKTKENKEIYTAVAKTSDKNPFEPINAVYFTSFIVTQDSIYSTTQLLETVLALIQGKNIVETTKPFITMKEFPEKGKKIDIDKGKLQDLWRKKEDFIKRSKGLFEYKDIAADTGVNSILKELSDLFGVSSYDKVTMEMGKSGMKKLLENK